MIEIPIDSIVVGDRHRKDLGDIDGLAKSIESLGLLQAIGITKRNELVFGERRLLAFQKLGRRTIPCKIVDVPRIVDGEYAENHLRKDFTITERVAIADAVAKEIGDRRGGANNPHGKKGKPKELESNAKGLAFDSKDPESMDKSLSIDSDLPVRDKTNDTAHIAAERSGLGSRENLRKAKEVMKAAEENPEQFGDLPVRMDKSGRVNGAYGELKKRKDREQVKARAPAVGKFRTLVIDPPWHYDSGTPSRADTLYATMKVHQIEALPVREWADDENCHLWLWTTNFHLPHAVNLIKVWGFTYKGILTWVKPSIGAGPAYFRNSTEHCLFGLRGKLGIEARDIASHFGADVLAHSEKPEAFYDIVRRASIQPFGEAFQRQARPDFADLIPIKDAA